MVINKVLSKMKQSLTRSTGGPSRGYSRTNANANRAASTTSSGDIGEELNMERSIETPGERDILLGRGRTSWSHTGNQQFRSFIGMYLKQYTESKNRTKKTKTVHTIYDAIIEAGGRFLKQDTATKTWYQVAKSVAREKIAHTLRDAVGLRIKLTVPDNCDVGGPLRTDGSNNLGGGRSGSKSKSGGGSIFAQKPPTREEAKTAPSPFPLFSAAANDCRRPQLFVAKDTRPDGSVSAEEVLSSSTATRSNVLSSTSTESRSNISMLSSSQAGGDASAHQGSRGNDCDPHRSFIPGLKKNGKKEKDHGGANHGDGRHHSGLNSVNSGSVRSADKKSFNDLVNSMITELGEGRHNNDATSATRPNSTSSENSKNTAASISKQRQEHQRQEHQLQEHQLQEQQLQEQQRLHQEQQLLLQEQQLHSHHDFNRSAETLADDDVSAGFSAMSLETSKSGRSLKSGNMSRSKCDSKDSNDGREGSTAMFELSEEFRTARSHNNTPSPTNAGLVGNVGIQSTHDQVLLLRHRGNVANCTQPSVFENGGPNHRSIVHHGENGGTSFGVEGMDWAKGGDAVSEMGSLDDFSLISRETGHSSHLTRNSRSQSRLMRGNQGTSQDSRKESSMDSSEKSSETEREWRRTLQALRSS